MLLAAARRLVLAPMRGALSATFGGQTRGVKGKVLKKPMWDGWPRYSPDRWPYARYMKGVRKGEYETKQAWQRAKGMQKGTRACLKPVRRARASNGRLRCSANGPPPLSAGMIAQELQSKVRQEPEFTTSSSVGPVVTDAGLRRPTAVHSGDGG
jgi:hypothetical protein